MHAIIRPAQTKPSPSLDSPSSTPTRPNTPYSPSRSRCSQDSLVVVVEEERLVAIAVGLVLEEAAVVALPLVEVVEPHAEPCS